MGSSGSGRFTDYSGSKNTDGTGGTGGVDRCRQAVSCVLEEVSQCDFYTVNRAVPPVGTEVLLAHDRRLFAVMPDGTKIGALPTAYNYLAACMRDGNTYVGVVSRSGLLPIPFVAVDFTAQ
ncbi:hypothetical protein [Rhizobium sp. M1]|uniref:hypothetical protein n=1 Tax=Rhizobium sp. M1 TaxID=2035453 RepID=UPI001AECB5A1|nr:hypothetical protein [Rhizobium sp. M1]